MLDFTICAVVALFAAYGIACVIGHAARQEPKSTRRFKRIVQRAKDSEYE